MEEVLEDQWGQDPEPSSSPLWARAQQAQGRLPWGKQKGNFTLRVNVSLRSGPDTLHSSWWPIKCDPGPRLEEERLPRQQRLDFFWQQSGPGPTPGDQMCSVGCSFPEWPHFPESA